MRIAFPAVSACALALAAAYPAQAGLTRVDFKYTSLAHLGFQGSIAESSFSVPESVDLIANFLRSNGASVTAVKEFKTGFEQTPGDRECEAWSQSIFRTEQSAIRANKWKLYKKIDRSGMPGGCNKAMTSWLQYAFSQKDIPEGEGFFVEAVIDRSLNVTRSYVSPMFTGISGSHGSASMWSMVPRNTSSSVNLETRLIIHVWKETADRKTSVFAIALPRMGQVEAAPGASVGADFFEATNGTAETMAVQNLLSYVTQKSLKP